MTRPNILIIDDDSDYLEEMCEILTGADYTVNTLQDSMASISTIKNIHPDVVLLDLKMDGKNGFQVAKEIQQDPEINQTPVIAVTGYFTENEHHKLLDAYKLKRCLLKPVKPLDVIHNIEEILKNGNHT